MAGGYTVARAECAQLMQREDLQRLLQSAAVIHFTYALNLAVCLH